MTSVGEGEDFINLDLSDEESNLLDIVRHPEKHNWKIHFTFPSDEQRDPFATLNKKRYGGNPTFEYLYEIIATKFGMPFIDMYFESEYRDSDTKEFGDSLITLVNEELGIKVNTLATQSGDLYRIERNIAINKTRMSNALARLNDFEEQYFEFQKYVYDIEPTITIAKHGSYDRRTKEYHDYVNGLSKLDAMEKELERLRKRAGTEEKRYENSLDKKEEDAVEKLKRLKDGTLSSIRRKCDSLAAQYAREVKSDIISKARIGILPMQNLPLSEATIKNRRYAALPDKPRFWATGQLVRSIIITCTLN